MDIFAEKHNPRLTPNGQPSRNSYGISPAASNEAPWTTARCNRLLRPLSSRIKLLKKHNLHHTASLRPSSTTTVSTGRTESTGAVISNTKLRKNVDPQSERWEQDPDWAPEESLRRRPRRTYTTRTSAATTRRVEPRIHGGIHLQAARIPSPFIQKVSIAGEGVERPISVSPLKKALDAVDNTRRQKSESKDSFRRLAKSVEPSQWMLFDGLYSGLSALLKATAKAHPYPKKGAMSLFSMCLRSVPQFIMEEQALAREEDPDCDEDVSAAVYDDLESFGAACAKGWKPLREVTRAHGILMLGNAIRDGTITPSIARGIIILCLQARAFPEAESLLSSMISTTQPLKRPSSHAQKLFTAETSISLQTLKDVATESGRLGFLYRSLSLLLRKNILPVEWVACRDMESCWAEVITSIVQGSGPIHDASELLQTVISLSYQNDWKDYFSTIHSYRLNGRRNERSSKSGQASPLQAVKTGENSVSARHCDDKIRLGTTNTILHLITVLFAANNVNSEPSGPEAKRTFETGPDLYLLQNLARDLLQYHEVADWERDCVQFDCGHTVRSCMPALALLLLPASSPATLGSLSSSSVFPLSISLNASTDQKVIDTLGTFLCAIANCSSRMNMEPSFTHIQALVARLLSAPASAISVLPASRIAMSAAFEFAENSSQKKHLDWALEVEDLINRNTTSSISPRIDSSAPSSCVSEGTKTSAGFRWEESIGEWVSKTPAARRPPAKPCYQPPSPNERSSALRRLQGSSSAVSSSVTEESDLESEATPLSRPEPTRTLLSEISPLLSVKRPPLLSKRNHIPSRKPQDCPPKKRLRFSNRFGVFDNSDTDSSSGDFNDDHDSDYDQENRLQVSDSDEPGLVTSRPRNTIPSRRRNLEVEVRVPKLHWPMKIGGGRGAAGVEIRVPLLGSGRLTDGKRNDCVNTRVTAREKLADVTNRVDRRDEGMRDGRERRKRGRPVGSGVRRRPGDVIRIGGLGQEWSEDELGF